MANSLPFNAVAVDGEYDRVYKAEDWAWYFATFIANGIFPKPSDGLQVVAYSGMEIRVNAGYAFINGYAFRNPATLSVTLDTAEGALNRVDRVVVRWDLPQRDMYIAVLKGTPSVKPTATAVTRTTEIWELALADIYVGKGVTRIQTQNITDQRFNNRYCYVALCRPCRQHGNCQHCKPVGFLLNEIPAAGFLRLLPLPPLLFFLSHICHGICIASLVCVLYYQCLCCHSLPLFLSAALSVFPCVPLSCSGVWFYRAGCFSH